VSYLPQGMLQCRRCYSQAPAYLQACPVCGFPGPDRRSGMVAACPRCGAVGPAEASICGRCGTRMGARLSPIQALLGLLGGLIVAAGGFLPWASVPSVLGITLVGTSPVPGYVALAVGTIGALSGLVALAEGQPVSRFWLVATGVISLLDAGFMVLAISARNHQPAAVFSVEPAIGILAVAVGGLVLTVAGCVKARWE
jgi:RNA polymerase subunit RPABC4/transcription elongation factor Spt4